MSAHSFIHVPVLQEETLELLHLNNGMVAIDATLGAGGHARLIIQAIMPGGQFIGIEQDAYMMDVATRTLSDEKKRYGENVLLTLGNFRRIDNILKTNKIEGL